MTDPVSNPDASDELQADPAKASAESNRGRHADSPTQIPSTGWRDILARVRLEAKDDHVSLLAAGVAFYSLLAAVPALVAVISIYGLVADPADIGRQVVDALAAAPGEVRDLVTTQLESIAGSSSGATLLAALLGVALALWSASSGVSHLIDALNVAYDETERRGFVKRKLLALGFTVGAIAFVVVAFGVIAILPALVADTGLGGFGRVLVGVVRWAVLFAGMIAGLSILYRYGPDRDEPQWRWTSPGAILAAVLWIAGSLLFSLYTANFAKYNETYGSLGAIVVVMLWLFLTATVVIIGAEVNAELERQTLSDTTEGPSRPLGQRDAYAADTVGETADQVKSSQAAT
ncbi:MAG: YihY/virulence factor BrkB family protein [Ilumatobacteraceae bacterium]